MRIKDWIDKNWRYIQQISEWLMLAVLIYVIYHFMMGRAWCYNLVQPFIDYYTGYFRFKGYAVNSTNFDKVISDLMSNTTKNCTCFEP